MDTNDISDMRINSEGSPMAITLGKMPQQTEVREPGDDWTGLNNPKERRRLQNRLNQRIWRKRQQAKKAKVTSQKASLSEATDSSSSVSNSMAPSVVELDSDAEAQVASKGHESNDNPPNPSGPPHFSWSLCQMTTATMQDMMSQFEACALQNYFLGSPRVDLLLTLIQFNVFRALISNTVALGFDMAWLNEDAISPFTTTSPESWVLSLPENLRPTELQHKVAHHPWIDLFPVPTMRDNLLRAGASYDDTELCMDVVEIGNKPKEQAGLIVWGEPSDIYAWEASPTFLQKWKWVVEGCDELLKSTNYWRMKRGEKRFSF